jgi:hypothetical protein
MPKLATCPKCKEPVVMTMMFPYKEFLCVCCGWSGGFFDPIPAPEDEVEEKTKRYEHLESQFMKATKDLISHSARRVDCKVCYEKREPHQKHMTEEEKTADLGARRALNELVGKELCTEAYP